MATEKLTFEMNAVGNAVPEMKKAQAQVQRLGKSMATSNRQMTSSGRGFKNLGMVAQQAGFQVGDMAVQVAGGTSAIQAFGQQGSQLLGVFGPVGAVLGAVVAIGSAVAVAFQRAGESAEDAAPKVKTFDDAMTALETASNTLNSTLAINANTLEEVQRKYGALTDDAREFVALQRELAEQEVITKIGDAFEMITVSDSYIRAAGELKRVNDEVIEAQLALKDVVDQGLDADTIKDFNDSLQESKDKLKKLEDQFEGTTSAALMDAQEAFLKAFNAKNLDGMKAAIVTIRKEIVNLPVELRQQMLPNILKMEGMIRTVSNDFNTMSGTIDNVGSSVSKAADKVKNELTPEMKKAQSAGQAVGASFETAFMQVAKGTKSAKEAFSSMAMDIIAELYRIFVVKRITGFIETAVTGFFNSAGAMATGAPLPARAIGGPVQAGSPYMVGERGPELFVPSRTGSIVSNDKLGGGGLVVHQTVNISTGVQQTVRNEIQTLLPQIAEASKAAVLEARRRGGSFANAF